MSGKYTPGEWIAFQNEPQKKSGQWSVGLKDKHGYHGVGDGDRYMLISGCCDENDAILIAAAPELLDAVQSYVDAYDNATGTVYLIDQMREALAKATRKA